MVYKRKRTYGSKPSTWGAKRARTGGRKRRSYGRKRAGKSLAFTSQSGVGRSMSMRSKKLSRSRYRQELWRITNPLSHMRSTVASALVLTTGTVASAYSFNSLSALENGLGRFYQVAGGAVSDNVGAPFLPAPSQNIIIRGGIIGLKINNPILPLGGDTLYCTVYLVNTVKRPDASILPAGGSNVNVGYDLSLIPNFNEEFGRVLMKKEFILADGQGATIEKRIKTRRVDQDVWATYNGTQPTWFILLNSQNTTTAQIEVVRYWNVSYSII